MYRGLTTNQQVGDRYGRSPAAIAASVSSNNNATSNGEYGGWFGHSAVSHPTLSRAKSETVWRTGNISTAGNTASIQDIMQLLKQGQSPRPVIANATRSGPNGLSLVGSRTNPAVQQAPPSVSNGITDPTVASNQSPQGNRVVERYQHNGEHIATNHLPNDGPQKRWPFGTAEISNADPTNLSKTNGVHQPQQQRGFNYLSPANNQRLAGSLQSDQIRLMKSATTLGFAPERAGASDEQNTRNSTSNFKTPGPNVPGNRNIYNAGPVPIWRNRWSQSRPQYRLGQPAARPGPMTTSEAIYRPETAAYLNTPVAGGSNAQGTLQVSTDNGRSISWQTTGTADDVASAVLANRLREDRTLFHPERANSKLETVTAVEFMAPGAKQRPGVYANFNEENPSKFGRHGLGSAFDRNNPSYPPKLVPEGFRSNGSGMVPSNGSMYSQLDHENKVAKSHLVPEISEQSFARSPGHATVSNPRLGTNCAAQGSGYNAAPKRSILKKPKIHSTDYESGINAKRRMEGLYPMRHSAGSVGCFNGLSHAGQAISGVDNFQNRRQESNQKRVTFKLDQ